MSIAIGEGGEIEPLHVVQRNQGSAAVAAYRTCGEWIEMRRRIVLGALPERVIGVNRDLTHDEGVGLESNATLVCLSRERLCRVVRSVLAVDVRSRRLKQNRNLTIGASPANASPIPRRPSPGPRRTP